MEDNIWHVYPVNDINEHITEAEWKTIEFGYFDHDGKPKSNIDQRLVCKCKCGPAYKEQPNGAIIVVHNSFDGREGLEWVNEIFKK